MAPPRHTERFRQWLATVTNDSQYVATPETSPGVFIRKESAALTLDYLSRSRAVMRKAGVEPGDWDESRAQQIAETLPWLLIKD